MFLNSLLDLFKKPKQSDTTNNPASSTASTIIYHSEQNTDRAFVGLSAEEMQEIEEHIKKYIGPFEKVLHEIVSDGMHLDVIHVPARKEFPFHTLVTLGASEKPMTMPDGVKMSPYAEYLIFLPENWPMDAESWKNEANYWPVRMLKTIARIPYEYKTWLSYGHTIPNGNPPEAFDSSTELKGSLITFPYLIQNSAVAQLKGKNKDIFFWCIAPIHEKEWEFKLNEGIERLEDIANEKEIPMVLVHPNRPSVV